MSEPPWLLVGLGNPGPKYAGTPHNIGFGVVEELAHRAGLRFGRSRRAHADVAEGHLGRHRAILVEPLSFMNMSGGPVKALLDYSHVPIGHLVVIHDEMDIPFDSLRLKSGGGDNGHNGLRSLRKSLGHGDYLRVRVGVGRPEGRRDPVDYLLRPFPAALRKELPFLLDRAADAVEVLMDDGLAQAQNRYNS